MGWPNTLPNYNQYHLPHEPNAYYYNPRHPKPSNIPINIISNIVTKPASPLPGSEEYTQNKIQQTSDLIKRQLNIDSETCSANEPDFPPNLIFSECSNNNSESESQGNTTNIDSPNRSVDNNKRTSKQLLKRNKSPEIFDVQEIYDQIIKHISNLSYSKKMNLVNQSTSGYDIAIQEIQRQKRLELSRALRDISKRQTQSSDDGEVINAIIPDIGIKIEDLPNDVIAELSNSLNVHLDEQISSLVDPEACFKQAEEILNVNFEGDTDLKIFQHNPMMEGIPPLDTNFLDKKPPEYPLVCSTDFPSEQATNEPYISNQLEFNETILNRTIPREETEKSDDDYGKDLEFNNFCFENFDFNKSYLVLAKSQSEEFTVDGNISEIPKISVRKDILLERSLSSLPESIEKSQTFPNIPLSEKIEPPYTDSEFVADNEILQTQNENLDTLESQCRNDFTAATPLEALNAADVPDFAWLENKSNSDRNETCLVSNEAVNNPHNCDMDSNVEEPNASLIQRDKILDSLSQNLTNQDNFSSTQFPQSLEYCTQKRWKSPGEKKMMADIQIKTSTTISTPTIGTEPVICQLNIDDTVQNVQLPEAETSDNTTTETGIDMVKDKQLSESDSTELINLKQPAKENTNVNTSCTDNLNKIVPIVQLSTDPDSLPEKEQLEHVANPLDDNMKSNIAPPQETQELVQEKPADTEEQVTSKPSKSKVDVPEKNQNTKHKKTKAGDSKTSQETSSSKNVSKEVNTSLRESIDKNVSTDVNTRHKPDIADNNNAKEHRKVKTAAEKKETAPILKTVSIAPTQSKVIENVEKKAAKITKSVHVQTIPESKLKVESPKVIDTRGSKSVKSTFTQTSIEPKLKPEITKIPEKKEIPKTFKSVLIQTNSETASKAEDTKTKAKESKNIAIQTSISSTSTSIQTNINLENYEREPKAPKYMNYILKLKEIDEDIEKLLESKRNLYKTIEDECKTATTSILAAVPNVADLQIKQPEHVVKEETNNIIPPRKHKKTDSDNELDDTIRNPKRKKRHRNSKKAIQAQMEVSSKSLDSVDDVVDSSKADTFKITKEEVREDRRKPLSIKISLKNLIQSSPKRELGDAGRKPVDEKNVKRAASRRNSTDENSSVVDIKQDVIEKLPKKRNSAERVVENENINVAKRNTTNSKSNFHNTVNSDVKNTYKEKKNFKASRSKKLKPIKQDLNMYNIKFTEGDREQLFHRKCHVVIERRTVEYLESLKRKIQERNESLKDRLSDLSTETRPSSEPKEPNTISNTICDQNDVEFKGFSGAVLDIKVSPLLFMVHCIVINAKKLPIQCVATNASSSTDFLQNSL